MGLTDRNNPKSFEEMAANEEQVQTESTEDQEQSEETKEESAE